VQFSDLFAEDHPAAGNVRGRLMKANLVTA
jgi:hypothetical protein